MSTSNALEISDLSLAVGGRPLFRGLDLSLVAGQKMTLSGRSGCGKSTLLRALLGFVPPVAGQIRLFGQRLDAQSSWALRRRVAYVAQEPELADLQVSSLLERPFQFRANRHLHANLARVPQLLERLLLPHDLGTRRAAELSGGEKQRLALLAALLLERDILLLDEPSSALDDQARAAVIELLASHPELTLLAVSHDREWAAAGIERRDMVGLMAGGPA